MKKIEELQRQIGEVEIEGIEFDLTCRDEVPKLLIGLQHLYCEPELKKQIFMVLDEMIPAISKRNKGRKGMSAWEIFVLGMLRLNCNWDYDKLHDQANNHILIRQMLGKSGIRIDRYALRTLKDNISLFTPEILQKINEIIVKAGHELMGKKIKNGIKVKIDSFVVETDVHFPTDINLLSDAMRKIIKDTARFLGNQGSKIFRQSKHMIDEVKKKS